MMKNDDRCELFKKIALTALVAIISVTLVFPLLLKLQFITGFFNSDKLEPFIGIGAIMLVIVVYYWKEFWLFWKRYIETKRTGNFPLISIDFIFIYIFLVAVLVCVFRTFEKIIISNEFVNFLWVLIIISLIFFLVGLILSVKGLLIKRKSGKNDNEESRSSDDPITSPEQDRLRRGKFVDDLSKVIVSLPSELTGSFTIGLNGSWGEGKTSVINLLIKKLESDNIVIIQFDPWYYGGEEAILNAFYDQLEKALSEQFIFPGFKKSIARYLKLISTGVSFPGFKFDIHSPMLTIEKTKEQIGNYIQKVCKKVVIIIDDIDRLQPDEMALVFKLVRKNTNFKNTIFFLSFDPSIVKIALKENCNIDGDFLEKIINMPIPLPAIEPRSIEGYLLDEIKKVLNKIAIPVDEAKSLLDEIQGIYNSGITELFKTLRVTKRYLNSLSSSLPSIISEVNARDFLILEIIRVFNDDLYKKISENQELIAPSTLGTMLLEAELRKLGITSVKEKYISLMEGTKQKKIFESLLHLLFPVTFGRILNNVQPDYQNIVKNRNRKKISHPDCFPKYFLLQVPSLEISDEQLETMISIWKLKQPKERKESIKLELFKKDNEGNARTLEWIQKLKKFDQLIDSPLALSIIEVINENSNAFTRGQKYFNLSSSEFAEAGRFMVFLIKNKIGNQSKGDVLDDALVKTPDLLFSSFIIYIFKKEGLKSEPISDNNSIDLKSFQDKVAQMLKEYFIDYKIDIFKKYNESFEWDFILQCWGTYWEDWNGQFSEIIQDYVLSLVKDDEEKFYKFLNEMTDKVSPPLYIEDEFVRLKKWYDVTKFKEIALKFKDSNILSPEKKDLINKFLGSFADQPQPSQE